MSKWLKIKRKFFGWLLKGEMGDVVQGPARSRAQVLLRGLFPSSVLASFCCLCTFGRWHAQPAAQEYSLCCCLAEESCSHSSLIMQTLLDCPGPLAISAPIIVGSGSGLHMLPGIQCLTWTTQTENKREAGVTDGPHEWHGYRANAGLPKQHTKHTLGFLELALC